MFQNSHNLIFAPDSQGRFATLSLDALSQFMAESDINVVSNTCDVRCQTLACAALSIHPSNYLAPQFFSRSRSPIHVQQRLLQPYYIRRSASNRPPRPAFSIGAVRTAADRLPVDSRPTSDQPSRHLSLAHDISRTPISEPALQL